MDNNEQYPQYDDGQYYQDSAGYDPYQQYDNSAYQQYDNTDYQQYDNTGYPQYDNTGYPQYYDNSGFSRPTDFIPQFTPYEKPFKHRPWVKWVVLGILLVVIGLTAWYFVYKNGTRRSIQGLPDPVQTQADGGMSKKVDGYDVDITYKYSYSIDALVVHTKDYNGSKLSDSLSPVDLGLAWGNVAATNTEVDYHWEQSGRWIHWQINTSAEMIKAGGISAVNEHCSNNHIIPADSSVESTVKKIRRGDHVRLEGYLVDVYGKKPDGTWFSWNSSTSRTDTGDGACEVFYVTSAQIVD